MIILDYRKYAESQIGKIQTVKEQKVQALGKIKNTNTTLVGTKLYSVAPEQKAAMTNQAAKEFDAEVKRIISETSAHLSEARKKAFQALTAAQPVPGDSQRAQANDIVKQYARQSSDMQRELKFKNELSAHLENATVRAHPYMLAATEIFGENFVTDEMRDVIAPALKEKRAALQNIQEAVNDMEIFRLSDCLMQGNLSTIDSISIKQQIFDLGGDPNISEPQMTQIS